MPNQGAALLDGHVVVPTAGTPVQLIATTTICRGVWVTASPGNTKAVAVGAADVKATAGQEKGLLLNPTSPAQYIAIEDAARLWVDAAFSGEGIAYSIIEPMVVITRPTGVNDLHLTKP